MFSKSNAIILPFTLFAVLTGETSAQVDIRSFPPNATHYFWSDDVGRVVTGLLSGPSTTCDISPVDAFKSLVLAQASDRGPRTITSAESSRIEHDCQLIYDAVTGEVFRSGAAVMIFPDQRWSIVSPIDCDAEEVGRFFAAMDRIANLVLIRKEQTRLAATRREDQSSKTIAAPVSSDGSLGFWIADDDLCVWACDEDLTLSLIEHFREPENCLGDERLFRRLDPGRAAGNEHEGRIDFFLGAKALPDLSQALFPFISEFFALNFAGFEEYWNESRMSELRALSGSICLRPSILGLQQRASVTLDLRIATTRPRRGMLRSLRHKNGPAYNVAIGDVDLRRFSSFEIDGDHLVNTGRVFFFGEGANTASNSLSRFAEVTGIEEVAVRSVSGLCEYSFRSRNTRDSGKTELTYRTALKVSPEVASESIKSFVDFRLRRYNRDRESVETIEFLQGDRFSRWKIKDSVIDDYEEYMLSRVPLIEEQRSEKIRNSLESGQIDQSEADERLAELESRLKRTAAAWRSISAHRRQTGYFTIDDWFYITPLPLAASEGMLEQPRHPRLEELESLSSSLERTMSIRSTFGVIGYWLTKAERGLSQTAKLKVENAGEPNEAMAVERIPQESKERAAVSFRQSIGNALILRNLSETNVLLFSEEPGMIRISGASFADMASD